jgi:hypothetical protein
MSFLNDFKDANATFTLFKDEITKHIKGDIVDIESRDSELAKWFDIYSGIDAIHLVNNQMRGVAIRCQWGGNFKTFTIRYTRANGTETEYEKRYKAIYGDFGFWYPHITIQAYFDKREDPDNLLGYGIILTKDLFDYLSFNLNFLLSEQTRVCPEGNTFLWVTFNELAQAGKRIIIGDNSIVKIENPLVDEIFNDIVNSGWASFP